MKEGTGSALNTTKAVIQSWLRQAKKLKATHLLVVCDASDYLDHEDYPVFVIQVPYNQTVTTEHEYAIVKRVHNVKDYVTKYYQGHEMQRIMGVYLIDADWEEQISQEWNFRYE